MKIKSGFIAKEIAGQHVVIALGAASKIFNGIIKLNESGKFIWDLLLNDIEREAVIEAMLAEYDVTRETAEADVDKFIAELKGANILE